MLPISSDKHLILLLKQGHNRAFEALYERYWDKLLQKAYARLLNIEDAQEVVQELFINLWERRDNLVIKTSLSIYRL